MSTPACDSLLLTAPCILILLCLVPVTAYSLAINHQNCLVSDISGSIVFSLTGNEGLVQGTPCECPDSWIVGPLRISIHDGPGIAGHTRGAVQALYIDEYGSPYGGMSYSCPQLSELSGDSVFSPPADHRAVMSVPEPSILLICSFFLMGLAGLVKKIARGL